MSHFKFEAAVCPIAKSIGVSRFSTRRFTMRPLALMFLGLIVGCTASGNCYAVNVTLLPRIPNLPATLGSGGGQTGATLGTSVQGSITITDPELNPGIQTAFDAYSTPLGYVYGADERESSDGRAVAIGTTAGFINSKANSSPGKLRAIAVAGGGGGSVTGTATATALFVDTAASNLKCDIAHPVRCRPNGNPLLARD